MSVEHELNPCGFAWDRASRKPCALAERKIRRRKKRGHTSKPYATEYRRKQRERWLRLGIVKPINEAEAVIARGPQDQPVTFFIRRQP